MFGKVQVTSVEHARRLARKKLPNSVYWFIEAGTEKMQTTQANCDAFREIGFRPRVLDSHAPRELRTTVFGRELAMPVITSPAGFIRVAHRDGELGVARATAKAGIPIGLGILASYPVEAIVEANPDTWFQLYMIGGREGSAVAIERARRAGCRALIVTVDFAGNTGGHDVPRGRPVPGKVDLRTAIRYAPEVALKPMWALDFLRGGVELTFPNAPPVNGGAVLNTAQAAGAILTYPPTWDDIAWVRRQWQGPLIVKGITAPEDARRAVEAGVDAISVSNHGGNALDTAPATIRALPDVVDAVNGKLDVFLDGGIRHGTDVVKAVALGAKAVLIGRPYIWGMAAGGEQGVTQVLDVLKRGITGALMLLGCPSVQDLGPQHVILPGARKD